MRLTEILNLYNLSSNPDSLNHADKLATKTQIIKIPVGELGTPLKFPWTSQGLGIIGFHGDPAKFDWRSTGMGMYYREIAHILSRNNMKLTEMWLSVNDWRPKEWVDTGEGLQSISELPNPLHNVQVNLLTYAGKIDSPTFVWCKLLKENNYKEANMCWPGLHGRKTPLTDFIHLDPILQDKLLQQKIKWKTMHFSKDTKWVSDLEWYYYGTYEKRLKTPVRHNDTITVTSASENGAKIKIRKIMKDKNIPMYALRDIKKVTK